MKFLQWYQTFITLLFDENGKVKRWKGNIREGSREGKTGTLNGALTSVQIISIPSRTADKKCYFGKKKKKSFDKKKIGTTLIHSEKEISAALRMNYDRTYNSNANQAQLVWLKTEQKLSVNSYFPSRLRAKWSYR